MLRCRKYKATCQLIAVTLQTVLLGLFLNVAHQQLPDRWADYPPLSESRLVAANDFNDSAALSRSVKRNDTQSLEGFFASGIPSLVYARLSSFQKGNLKPSPYRHPVVGALLIRSPPSNSNI
jgi:hypothetical protein